MQIEMSNKLTIGLADILERNCSLRILEIGVSAHQGVKIFCRSTTPLAPLAVLAYGAPVIRWWLKDSSAILHSQNNLSNDKSFNILCFSSEEDLITVLIFRFRKSTMKLNLVPRAFPHPFFKGKALGTRLNEAFRGQSIFWECSKVNAVVLVLESKSLYFLETTGHISHVQVTVHQFR